MKIEKAMLYIVTGIGVYFFIMLIMSIINLIKIV